ncbi:MAG: sensor histidine kinase [Pseudomarimonas sp.]
MIRLLPRSFTGQLLAFSSALLLAMLVLAAFLSSTLALQPSAEQMARSLMVLADSASRELTLQPRDVPSLSPMLVDAGVFPVLPVGSRPVGSLRPFPAALRDRLRQRLQRPVELVSLPDGEIALWLPSAEPTQMPFGLRFESARRPIAQVGLWVAVIGGVTLLLAAVWLARWLSRPLRRLSDALPALAAGAALPDLGRHAPHELRALADTLADAINRLREQAQVREQTLAGISHDLRTPLMRIALAAQLLPEHPHVATIQADVAEMDRMIGAALELARAGRQEPSEVIPLAELIERVLGAQAEQWTRDIDPDIHLRAPPIALRRAIENLVQNAERHGAPPFAVRAERTQAGLELSIIDSGSGFGELSVEAARQPFRQGSHASGGSGLGLAIVDRLATSFDATLQLEQLASGFHAVLRIAANRLVDPMPMKTVAGQAD